MIRLWGLSGGIASGKSLVAALIRASGVPVLDADQIARDVVLPGQPAYAQIATRWPHVIGRDQLVDRKALGQIVFHDPAERARLEAITHPRIREGVQIASQRLAADGHPLAFLEAALLVETGFYRQLDGLVLVTAPRDIQEARLMAREGVSRDEAQVRLAAQWSLAEKAAMADYLIDNGGSREHTQKQVATLLQTLAVPEVTSPA